MNSIPLTRPERPKRRWRLSWTDAERQQAFWSRVDIRSTDECWPWLGYIEKETGYGKFSFDGRLNSAHRYAFIAAHGPIPKGLLVCHKCDNRVCQNPTHLFLGTYVDNNSDMRGKGRGNAAKGVKHPSAKLTEEQVRRIRGLWVPYTMSIRKISQILALPYKACECAVTKWKSLV